MNSDEAVRDTFVKARFTRCWIKRADYQSLHKEDVSYVRQADEAQEVLQEYFLRGIQRAVISRHPKATLSSSMALPHTVLLQLCALRKPRAKQAVAATTVYDKARLHQICRDAAEALDVKIYGGDAIVDADGTIRLIDFDDWPSFAPCRKRGRTIHREMCDVGR